MRSALAAEAKPTLVKPNLTGINDLLGTAFTPADLPRLRETLAADARFAGIPWVVVSMAPPAPSRSTRAAHTVRPPRLSRP